MKRACKTITSQGMIKFMRVLPPKRDKLYDTLKNKQFNRMKASILSSVIMAYILMMFVPTVFAQESKLYEALTTKLYVVEKQNGTKFIGEIISQDAREILINTKERGEIYIPQHEIRSIIEIVPEREKDYISDDLFATRYFITTNGLPIKKGDNYIQWNIYGPDFQFGIADNFGIGIMTSWIAIPVIGNAKYSIDLGKNKSMALGLLAGTGSWALPEFGLLLPFVSLTYGDRRNNLTLSTGYGGIFYEEDEYNPQTNISRQVRKSEGRFLVSVAGIAKISNKFSLVFDTFISPIGPYQTRVEWDYKGYWDENLQQSIDIWEKKEITERSPNLALIIPGIRWQLDADRAFQFGFTGFYFDGEFLPFSIPMVQFYRRI